MSWLDYSGQTLHALAVEKQDDCGKMDDNILIMEHLWE